MLFCMFKWNTNKKKNSGPAWSEPGMMVLKWQSGEISAVPLSPTKKTWHHVMDGYEGQDSGVK